MTRPCQAAVVTGWEPCAEPVDGSFFCSVHWGAWDQMTAALRDRQDRQEPLPWPGKPRQLALLAATA